MSDIEIAQKTVLMPIGKIAAKLSIDNELLEPYGKTKAKLPLTLIDDEKAKKLSQTETEHTDLYESITNRRMSRFMPSRKENMQNNKIVSFSSIVE